MRGAARRPASEALLERAARGGDRLGVALELLHRGLEADVGEPLRGVLGGQPALAGESRRDRLEADMGDAGEEAGAAAGHGEVGDVAEAAVEDGPAGARPGRRRRTRPPRPLGGGRAGERADHREGGKVDPDRVEPGAAQRLDEGGDHLAPRRDDDHIDLSRAPLLGRAPPTTWYSSTAWSSGIGICSCA